MGAPRLPQRRLRRGQPSYHLGIVLVAWLVGAALASSCALERYGTGEEQAVGGAGGAGGAEPECTVDNVLEVCPGEDSHCSWRMCFNGTCGTEDAPEGTGCGSNPGAVLEVCSGNGECVLNWGQPCDQANQCRDAQCVEGYCCTGPCEGLCESCAVPTHEGVCSPSLAGGNDDGECGDGVCDGARSCVEGTYRWAQGFGDADIDESWGVAVDSAGHIIIAGWFERDIDFGGGILSAGANNDEAFVAKFESIDGELMWAHSFGNINGNNDDQRAYGVAVDGDDGIYVTGVFDATFGVGTGLEYLSTGGLDGFVVKFEPVNGDLLWVQTFGGAEADSGWDVAVIGQDHVVVTGYFESPTLSLPNSPVSADNADGGRDLFLLRLDNVGSPQWAHGFGDSADQCVETRPCTHLAVDGDDNVFLAAGVAGVIDFGGGALSADAVDVVLAKFEPVQGAHLWSQRFGEALDQVPSDVMVDGDGNVLLTGGFFGSLSFGGDSLTSMDGVDLFVAQLDPAGQHLDSWSRGTTGSQWGTGLAFDGSDSLLVLGMYEGAFDLGGTPLPPAPASGRNVFIAKYAHNGTHLWSYGFGDGSVQDGEGLAVLQDGAVVLSGFFEGSMDFGDVDGPLGSAGANDAFVAVFEP